jgi:hypothetical protein
MNLKKEVFGKYKNEMGEDFYCPINAVADNHIVSEWELDDSVDVATAGRYAGHFDIDD